MDDDDIDDDGYDDPDDEGFDWSNPDSMNNLLHSLGWVSSDFDMHDAADLDSGDLSDRSPFSEG